MHAFVFIAGIWAQQSPFNIRWNCSVDLDTCNQALVSFQRAANLIANQIMISETINVDASFFPFCPVGQECEDDKIVGTARASDFGTATINGKSLLYPSSYLKQLGLVDSSSTDIVATFNAHANLSFTATSISQSQTDFEFVVAHELTVCTA